jgi:outer membrane protein assembly factor BamA
LRWLELELPRGGFGDPWGLGEGLALVLADPPRMISMGPPRGYASRVDPSVQGLLALREIQGEAGGVVLTLTLSHAIPLVQADLAKVSYLLRQRRLPALGVLSPVVRLTLKDSDEGTRAQFRVLDQPQEKVQRLVVRGADRTRARAILRALRVEPGANLDPAALAEAQARLNSLGAFQWTGLSGLQTPQGDEALAMVPPAPWHPGDLLLDLKERPPWGVTSFFGYNASQGYYLGSGVQWLNVGGMGRTVDLGLRAGDHTIGNPTLRKWFPTGPYPNAIDSLSLGYQDPWFAPPALGDWLPEPTRFTLAVALIEQEQSLYLLSKHRFVTSLQWNPTPSLSFQAGYRLEQVAVTSGVAGIDSTMLAQLSRYPARAVFSAPFVQLTRDTRDSALDPTRGSYSVARLELANQLFLTSPANSFVKLDLRQQWTWPLAAKAAAGVVALGLRVGVAKPTAPSASNLPLSERFFGGGPFTQRCVVPDGLGPLAQVPVVDRETRAILPGQFRTIPVGGQGLAILNLEYRFPILAKRVWGELFLDSGQVYESLGGPRAQTETPAFPPLRTALGLGLIFKFGFPLKVEYGGDLKRILGQPRSATDEATQQKGVTFAIGYQF